MKIKLGEKEYESGKITKKKYKRFSNVVESMENHNFFKEKDIEEMQEAIIDIFNNQFTMDEMDEYWAVDDIIFNFSMINVDIMTSLNKKAKEANKVFQVANK